MRPLEELLAIYKAMLNLEGEATTQEVGDYERTGAPDFRDVEPLRIEELTSPQRGDVVEIVPPYDNLEMRFIILRETSGFFEVVPLSPFWEFATPKDVVIEVEGEPYIAQTDISFDVPLDNFTKRFGNRRLFKVGKVDEDILRRIELVCDGKEKGDGNMVGSIKGEFKKLEAQRWFALWTSQIAEEEALQELESLIMDLKEREASLAASEEETLYGSKEGIRWFYNERERTLVLLPEEELLGKEKRIFLDFDGERFILFEGKLPPRIEIPIRKEAYSWRILNDSLGIEDVQ